MSSSEWKEVYLGDIGKIVTGKTPYTKIKDNFGGNYPFITPRDIKEQKNIIETERYLSEKGLNSVRNQVLNEISICVSCIGSDMGKVIIVKGKCVTNQQINAITSIKEEYNPDFIYYKLKPMKKYFHKIADGSTMPIINKFKFSDIKIKVPKLEEQEKIALILSSLDDKIELNNLINKNLEQMAQAIFKNWFVDFEFPNENGEPYKSSGGEMVDSDLGPVPKEWKIEKLKKIIRFVKGKKPKIILKEKSDKLSKYLTINVLSGKDNLYAQPKGVILTEKENILMVMDGASSGKIYFGVNGIVASTIAKVEILNNNFSTEYIYHFLKYYEKEINDHITGSAIPHTDKNFVLSLRIALTDTNNIIFSKFNKTIESIENKIIQNHDENKRLAKIRDVLLPKLMSGEIRVPINIKG